MKALTAALLALALLGGCEILQHSYDHQARKECQNLPTPDERLACDRAASDAERARRAERLAR